MTHVTKEGDKTYYTMIQNNNILRVPKGHKLSPEGIRIFRASVKSYGLGDILERELIRMGITQDRYKEIKEKFGFPPTCGCEKRKQWLNKVGAYLGIGK